MGAGGSGRIQCKPVHFPDQKIQYWNRENLRLREVNAMALGENQPWKHKDQDMPPGGIPPILIDDASARHISDRQGIKAAYTVFDSAIESRSKARIEPPIGYALAAVKQIMLTTSDQYAV
jgi:hypothetical protein